MNIAEAVNSANKQSMENPDSDYSVIQDAGSFVVLQDAVYNDSASLSYMVLYRGKVTATHKLTGEMRVAARMVDLEAANREWDGGREARCNAAP